MLFVLLVRKGSLAFSHNPFPSVFLLVSPCAVPIFQEELARSVGLSQSVFPKALCFFLVITIAAHALLEPESC